MPCPRCSRPLPDEARFCPACGTSVSADESPATLTSAPLVSPQRARSTPAPGPGAGEPRFLPGTVLDGRYRIVGLVGRGGMGEVYRADDLKLGLPVALKFLPRSLDADPERLARLLNEVRLARQVSHPNVCRVHDVGEADGQHYLSMEYVDGEDLHSLLKRIGRFPEEKAAQMARQICAGLAAAHETGILHRDLKPANVLVDGRGRPKITDFGLAGVAESIAGEEVRVGTPAYQAPEQRAGESVSVRSDLYSLGLVLYEIFTGERAFRADSAAELARLQEESTPASLTSHVSSAFDPAVERIIFRCLERDPERRPATALAVAAALPGGDPLAAALAAGETPSPELVAAAGESISVPRWLSWTCLALVVVLLPVVLAINSGVSVSEQVPLEIAPAVLAARAQEIARELGYDDPPDHTGHDLTYDTEQIRYLRQHTPFAELGAALGGAVPGVVRYWYRQGPVPISPPDLASFWPTRTNPPMGTPGMLRVDLDSSGRLVGFLRVPTDADAGLGPPPGEGAAAGATRGAGEDAAVARPEPDWAALFSRAALDLGGFARAEPDRVPPVYADTLRSWKGPHPQHAGVEVTVRAAALHGKPVQFEVEPEWGLEPAMLPVPRQIFGAAVFLVLVVMFVTAVFLARMNLRLGRGDRKGARRFAIFYLAIFVAWWGAGADHGAGGLEVLKLAVRIGLGLLQAGAIWIIYLALEPFVRRRWPALLVSWTRLLEGRWRDPLVGRDLVLAAALSILLALLDGLTVLAPTFAGGQLPYLEHPLTPLLGGRLALASVLQFQVTIGITMLVLLVLTLARVLLKRDWAAFVAAVLFASAIFSGNAVNVDTQIAFLVLFALVLVALLVRFGLLAAMLALVLHAPLAHGAITTDLRAWHADPTIHATVLVVAVTLYGFVVSFGGRSLVGERVFRDA